MGRPTKKRPPRVEVAPPSPIGPRIRQLREAAGYSLRDLGVASGLTAQAIADLEGGKALDPKVSTILKLAAALGCSASWLALGPAG